MASYFDFHFHPVFKKFISAYEADYPSKRKAEDLLGIVVPDKAFMKFLDGSMFHFLGSQSCLDQINKGGYLFGVANIASLEYAIASSDSLMGFVLKTPLTDPLDKHYFDLVAHGGTSYYRLFIKELNLYSKLANIGSYRDNTGKAYINILSRKNAAAKPFDGYTGTTLAMAMEGGHNLNRNLVDHVPGDIDKAAAGPADAIFADFAASANTVLSPSQSLARLFKAMWAEDMDLMYITLTHLSYIWEMPLATHAYGMKLLKHRYFYPAGNGLTDAGKEVIATAYEMTADGKKTPVLIDVKHMSLKSRLDFYQYREDNKAKGYDKIPIIATHMAVTGMTAEQWVYAIDGAWLENSGTTKNPKVRAFMVEPPVVGVEKSYDEFKRVDYFFNPWNINLMDDDIVAIYRSNGLIGLSLDARIMGAVAMEKSQKQYDPTEYVSTDEYTALKKMFPDARGAKPLRPYDDRTDVVIDGDNEDEKDHMREVASYAFNIMHVLAVAMSMDNPVADPWAHIVMGSDYDGMIDPVHYALDCSLISGIESRLAELMPMVERSYLNFRPMKNGGKILPRTAEGKIDRATLAVRLRGIMYDNGRNFLKRWYEGKL